MLLNLGTRVHYFRLFGVQIQRFYSAISVMGFAFSGFARHFGAFGVAFSTSTHHFSALTPPFSAFLTLLTQP